MLRLHSARLALLAFVLSLGLARFAVAQEALDAPPLPPIPESQSPADFEYYGLMTEPGYNVDYVDAGGGDSSPAIGWTLQADLLFLTRSKNTIRPLVNGNTPFGIEALDLGARFGPRLSVVRHGLLGTAWDGEVTYFGVDGFQKTVASGNASAFLTNPNINFGARTVTTTYREKIYSTEFNLRNQVFDWFTFINGFRQIELGSDLFTDLVGASHQINVNNHLYGYQIGGDMFLLGEGDLTLNTWGKAGIYGNSADQATNIIGVGGATPNFGAQGGNVSFVGEVGLYGAYRWNEWLTLRAGYQVMWLDGIATAPNQIAPSDIVTGLAAVNFAETLLYHGGFTGIEMYW